MAFARPSATGGLAIALVAGTALAQPPAATGEAQNPPAPPAATPPKPALAKAPPAAKRAAGDPLPEPELRVRVIAPSAHGPWTMRLENEGQRWLRVPADVRLLHFVVESGDTMAKGADKPVKCSLPAAMRSEGFPEPNAILLGPGDAYQESFDPRLFCFGKDAKALEGGALVRATYGWEPKGARKLEPPFAVEGTVFPAAVQPKKEVAAPPLVLSWLPPPEHEEAPPNPPAARPVEDPPREEKPATADKLPVDENAPRFEIKTPAYADAATARAVSLSVTVTNIGHRPALAAIRPRMIGFRVEGPDGVVVCPHDAHLSVPREGYQTIRPGGSTSITMLAVEACGQDLFRRPGLYRVTPTLHLTETGEQFGLLALTGSVRAPEPMLVRVATGPDPFYARRPQALRAPHAEGEDGAGAHAE
jgi:hypothetical protein